MASIGSLSSSTSNSLVSGGGGLHGYGSLASGLDRDTLIESMTYGTRAKIAKQQQKKQTFQWKQDAYRSVTDKLVALSTKYMDYTNPSTNLSNSSLFAKTNIVANGKNASKVSVTSTGNNAADSLTILGVKQMAKKATATTEAMTKKILETGDINASQYVSKVKGQSFEVNYNGTAYTVKFEGLSAEDVQSNTPEQIMQNMAKKMNEALGKIKLKGEEDTTLSSVMEFTGNANGLTIQNKSGNSALSINSSSEAVQKALGLEKDSDGMEVAAKASIAISKEDLIEQQSFANRIKGKSLSFTYNGQTANIRISEEDLENVADKDVMEKVKTILQDGLNKAFGKNRIAVGLGEGEKSFTFKAVRWDSEKNDTILDETSILTLNSSSEVTGEDGAFNTIAGKSNRFNLNTRLKDLPGATSLSLEINGKQLEGITEDSTINDIISKINKQTNVTVTYLQNSDQFMITADADGAGGEIELKGDLAKVLFGADGEGKLKNQEDGQDAIITVQYDGSSKPVDLYRGSNTFTQDGLNITIKGKFGNYDEDGQIIEDGEEVTFESTANVDSLLSTIKDMVNAYNEVVDLVNSLVSTKPDRDYSPLSDDQKEEMTEEQIEKWEKKAKEGILFGDDLLRNLSSDLRFVASGSFLSQLESIGITEVSGYQSNGKLTIDETKLKNALTTDPDKVGKLFSDTKNGLMTNLKKVTDSYAKTWGTKGSLIQRAGSESSAISLTDNELYKSMKDIDSIISQLQDRLKSEQDRYISQFTTLETLIAQMNSQSSYLSSMTGGY